MTAINQKEYLKKYLSIGSEPGKKKKRKKGPKTASRVKIIDYDDEVNATFTAAVEEDLYGTAEDAPQIVGITDDRPLALRANDYKISEMWKPLGGDSGDQAGPSKLNPTEQEDRSPTIRIKQESEDGSPPRRNRSPDEDASPPRKHRRKGSDSPPRKSTRENDREAEGSPLRWIKREDDDNSPPRKGRRRSVDSPPRKTRRDDEESLQRKNRRKNDSPQSKNRRENRYDGDMSPPRKNRRSDDDGSSPNSRRRRNIDSPIRKSRKDDDISPPRRDKGRQLGSPIRRARKDEDMSPPRRNNPDLCNRNRSPPSNSGRIAAKKSGRNEDDISPPRRSRKSEEDSSPPRRREDKGRSPKRKSRWDRNPSPKIKKEKSSSPKPARMLKTLDGKKAGLQSAQELVVENQALKKRENELFKKMSEEASGVGASTIVRDRKTGKIRDFESEAQVAKKQKEEDDKRVEKYAVWGKGVKQTEDHNEKVAQDLYEMSKPLARYADDEDLERYLKEQEREGDPMLAYIRKKKRKQAVIEGKPAKPEYMGEFMPNRYGIRPGHRWDGVDRSNGYEQKWFETINKKKALQEDSYRWNSEDM